MKIQHIWSVLCNQSLINSDNNALYINGIFEELTIWLKEKEESSKEMNLDNVRVDIPVDYEIVSMWRKDVKEGDIPVTLKIDVISPSGETLGNVDHTFIFSDNLKRFRSRIKFSGLKIIGTGTYWFIISIKEQKAKKFEEVSRIPLEIIAKTGKPLTS